MRDEVAGFKNCFAMRRASGQEMKIAERYCARALRSLHMNSRFQRCHRHTHVRWIRRNALIAGSENGERAIASGDGRTTSSRLAFIARHRGITKIDTPRSLQKVPSGGSHVTKLTRGACENRLREN